MQFQLECNNVSLVRTTCLICKNKIGPKEARVIVWNELGSKQGELCSHCTAKGMLWIENQLQPQYASA